MEISFESARAYLERDHDRYLMPLGALTYDPVRSCVGAYRGDQIAALALVADLGGAQGAARPTIIVAADDEAALADLLAADSLPAAAVWTVDRPGLLAALERHHAARHSPRRGVRYYRAAAIPERPSPLVRRITYDDAEATDLSPCGLSPAALRGWLRRGWRMFGAVSEGALICHALAAYPLGDTEEVSAVFTAPRARRRGLASAVVAATAADILRRGRRPIYVTARSNRASRRVAEGLGFQLIGEWWEVVT